MTEAKWYFDFISPFAYLQLARFSTLPGNLEITAVPVVSQPFRSVCTEYLLVPKVNGP